MEIIQINAEAKSNDKRYVHFMGKQQTEIREEYKQQQARRKVMIWSSFSERKDELYISVLIKKERKSEEKNQEYGQSTLKKMVLQNVWVAVFRSCMLWIFYWIIIKLEQLFKGKTSDYDS